MERAALRPDPELELLRALQDSAVVGGAQPAASVVNAAHVPDPRQLIDARRADVHRIEVDELEAIGDERLIVGDGALPTELRRVRTRDDCVVERGVGMVAHRPAEDADGVGRLAQRRRARLGTGAVAVRDRGGPARAAGDVLAAQGSLGCGRARFLDRSSADAHALRSQASQLAPRAHRAGRTPQGIGLVALHGAAVRPQHCCAGLEWKWKASPPNGTFVSVGV